jgi:glycosyltransferase involved in cell wall biosynthesis
MTKNYDVEFILLDVGSTDGLFQWLTDEGLLVKIKYVKENLPLHMSKLKNRAHQYASGDLLVSLDADNGIGPLYCERLLSEVQDDHTLLHAWSGDWTDGTCGRMAYSLELFNCIGGYDESMGPVGSQDIDLRDRTKASGKTIRVITEEDVVGFAIPNSKDYVPEVFGCDWQATNSRNHQMSKDNIAKGKLKANVRETI